jgi:Heavy metal binding domain
MNFRKLLLLPLLAVALIVTTASGYAPGVSAQQKERSAHSKRPTQFHFVCPMHENVTSKQRGTCHKCKMTLVKRRAPKNLSGSHTSPGF